MPKKLCGERADCDLQSAVGAVLETHGGRKPARHLAVGLRLGRARADRVPTDEVGQILGRQRIQRFAAGRQAEAGESQQQFAGASHPLADVKRVVHVRVVDEPLPTGGGARLLKVDAHYQQQHIGDLLGKRA